MHCSTINLTVHFSFAQSVLNDGPQTLATVQCVNGVVGSPNTVEDMRNVVIHWNVSTHHPFHELRDICSTFEPTKCGSFPHTPGDQLERASGDFMPTGRNAYNTRFSPSAMRTFQCRSHDIRIASAVNRIIHSPYNNHSTKEVIDFLTRLQRGYEAYRA